MRQISWSQFLKKNLRFFFHALLRIRFTTHTNTRTYTHWPSLKYISLKSELSWYTIETFKEMHKEKIKENIESVIIIIINTFFVVEETLV